MNDEEILQKAIEKANRNGYRGFAAEYYQVNKTPMYHADALMLIFSHDFAKAFFGRELLRDQLGEPNGDPDYCIPEWQYHLQQMVLEEEPVKYLEKFL